MIRTAGLMTLNTLKTPAPPKSNWPLGTAAPCRLNINIIIINFWSMISHSISWPGVFLSTHGILVKYFKHRYLDIGVPDQIPCRQSKYLQLSGYPPPTTTTTTGYFPFVQAALNLKIKKPKRERGINVKSNKNNWSSVSSKFSAVWGEGWSHKMPAINSPLSLDFITSPTTAIWL